MVSRKNPNGPSKNRLAARAGGIKKQAQRKSRAGQTKISQADAARGARPGLLPNSGPGAALSKKKQKKLEQQMRLALQRKMAAEGEVEMKDVPLSKADKKSKAATTADDHGEMDIE
ncbi:hypothetical protein B0H66DRAFT_550183 [Apodospora peruviana]|uniref:Uncharacterized protein n=1 Tax=Apodospora peruviana TaxID=516989 RepID=A0AAE0IJF8_9PEZI|nr:hypothetical protein B0H66DRAFT_550183 [Apodospora peruviana]